jgi:hypothetical protein
MQPTDPTYLHAHWRTAPGGCPIEMYSELDRDCWEIRKVEIFPGGRLQRAGPDGETGDTRLAELPLPTVDEISRDLQFEAREISAEEFERAWARANA